MLHCAVLFVFIIICSLLAFESVIEFRCQSEKFWQIVYCILYQIVFWKQFKNVLHIYFIHFFVFFNDVFLISQNYQKLAFRKWYLVWFPMKLKHSIKWLFNAFLFFLGFFPLPVSFRFHSTNCIQILFCFYLISVFNLPRS